MLREKRVYRENGVLEYRIPVSLLAEFDRLESEYWDMEDSMTPEGEAKSEALAKIITKKFGIYEI